MKATTHLLSGFLISLIFVGVAWMAKQPARAKKVELDQQIMPRVIEVDVSGAVVHPGIYDLNEDSRVFHAISAAGGFVAGADTRINLAAHLYDGQRLDVPYLGQVEAPVLSSNTPSALVNNDVMNKIPTATEGGEVGAIPLPTSTPGNYSCSDAAVGSGVFIWPTDAHFLSGNDFSYAHSGLDIAAGLGSPVYAADSGFVRMMGNDSSGYGNVVAIDHGNGYSTIYAHLSTIDVAICQSVNAGQRIGSAGNTGNADGAHLHFEVIQDGIYINPWSVLPQP